MNLGKPVKDLLYLCVHKSISRNGGVSESANYEICQMASTLNGYIRNITNSVYYAVLNSINQRYEDR